VLLPSVAAEPALHLDGGAILVSRGIKFHRRPRQVRLVIRLAWEASTSK
jgi:hypothetical protein